MIIKILNENEQFFTIEATSDETIADIIEKIAKMTYEYSKYLFLMTSDSKILDKDIKISSFDQQKQLSFNLIKINNDDQTDTILHKNIISASEYDKIDSKNPNPSKVEKPNSEYESNQIPTNKQVDDKQTNYDHYYHKIVVEDPVVDMVLRSILLKDKNQSKPMKNIATTINHGCENVFNEWQEENDEESNTYNENVEKDSKPNENKRSSPKTPKKMGKGKVSFVINEPSFHPSDNFRVNGEPIEPIHSNNNQSAASQTLELTDYPHNLLNPGLSSTNNIQPGLNVLAEEIAEMGFDYNLAVAALNQTNYDKEAAIDRILNGFVQTGSSFIGINNDNMNGTDFVPFSQTIGPHLPNEYPPSGRPVLDDAELLDEMINVKYESTSKPQENQFVSISPFEINSEQLEKITPILKNHEFQEYKKSFKNTNAVSSELNQFLDSKFNDIYFLFLQNPELLRIAITESFPMIEISIEEVDEGLSTFDKNCIENVF